MPRSTKPPQKTLLIDLAKHYGGAEVRVLQLAKAMSPENCQVACLQGTPLAQQLKALGFAPVEINAGKTSPKLARALRAIIADGSYSVIDAHNVQSYAWAYAAVRGQETRPALVATVHSSPRMEHPNSPKAWLYETIVRWITPRADHVITVSRFLESQLLGYGVPAERIARLPNAVEFQREGESAAASVRQELGIELDAPLIGVVARLEPAKGLDVLLNAVNVLRPGWPKLRCVIVGQGSLGDTLKRTTEALGIQEQVLFAGFRQDIPRLLEAFHVFVLPSRTEGIPFALLEACYCARAVVASRVGGIPEIIEDGKTGLLVPAGDPQALARAIEQVLRNPEQARQFGDAAAQYVSARYTMPAMLCGTEEAYQKAIARSRGRRI